MTQDYLELTRIIERLHRRFLDLLRTELNRMNVKDINAVQALMLANISGDEIVIRELIDRGYYQGSNVSYNIKKLVEFNYLEQERTLHDKRSVRVKLTDKAKSLVGKIQELEARNAAALGDDGIDAVEIQKVIKSLRRLERTWADYIQYGAF